MIGPVPASTPEIEGIARSLHTAAHKVSQAYVSLFAPEMRQAFETRLLDAQGNPEYARQLAAQYAQTCYQLMRGDLLRDVGQPEGVYTRYLLGENVMETGKIRREEAARLFEALSSATFVTPSGQREQVPFAYQRAGCQERAHFMTQVLREMGYESSKVFVVSRISVEGTGQIAQGLHLASIYGNDAGMHEASAVNDWFHVAPFVDDWVLDPAFADRPLTIHEWLAQMDRGKGDFTPVTLSQVQERLLAYREEHVGETIGFPPDYAVVFLTGRDAYGVPDTYPGVEPPNLVDPDATPFLANTRYASAVRDMTMYVFEAQVYSLAAEVRRALKQSEVSRTTIVDIFQLAADNNPRVVQVFSTPKYFSNLFTDVVMGFPAAAPDLFKIISSTRT